MLAAAIDADGPVAVRYPRGGQERTYPDWQGGGTRVLRQGGDYTLVSYGIMTDELMSAAETLAEQGIRTEVIKLDRIAPLDTEPVLASLHETRRLLVLEDCYENGSIGQQLAAAAAVHGCALKSVVLKNIKDRFVEHGSVSRLRREVGIDAAAVVEAVLEGTNGKKM